MRAMFLASKTALVTGGGRGIGRAIATALAAEGAAIVLCGRTEPELRATADDLRRRGARVTSHVVDLADPEGPAALLRAMGADAAPVHILVNNAGIAESAPLEKTSDAMWDRTFAVNVRAPFALCRALVPKMAAAGWGRVVNIASNAGLTGYPYTSAYAASKHAIVGLTRAIATEVAKKGVTVNAICPGWVETRMTEEAASRIASKTGRSEDDARKQLSAMSPQGRLITPEEVAHAVVMLCHDHARGIHGQTLVIDGGQVQK